MQSRFIHCSLPSGGRAGVKRSTPKTFIRSLRLRILVGLRLHLRRHRVLLGHQERTQLQQLV
jgi:hypothetical protein